MQLAAITLANGRSIIIKQGNIVDEQTDAIVNPANSRLLHGGGAARAIAVAGGEVITRQSQEIIRNRGYVPVGQAVITQAGNLLCQYVIHVVGPQMGEGDEEEKLSKAVWSVLSLAEQYELRSISMPAISSGIFGFPKECCAEILLYTVRQFLEQPNLVLKTVVMCNFDAQTSQIFTNLARNSSLFTADAIK